MLSRRLAVQLVSVAVWLAIPSCMSQAEPPQATQSPDSFTVRLSPGTATLDGPWRFHLGDSAAWASPSFDDSQWEQLSVDKPWGAQGHPNTEGFAWYRRRIQLPANSQQNLAILLPAAEDVYELYWNGRLIGKQGQMPPHPVWYNGMRPRTFMLGPVASGVLAIRSWKSPFNSFDSGRQGGLYASPVIGGSQAIAQAAASLDYQWLRSQQFSFALNSLYALVALLGLLAWLRNRSQWLVLWMACFAATRPVFFLSAIGWSPFNSSLTWDLYTVVNTLSDIAFWYVLLWLLDLRDDKRLSRFVYWLAIVDFADGILDGVATWGFSTPNPVPAQIMDGILTAILTMAELLPFYLIGVALFRAVNRNHRLDPARWIVALFAFLTQGLVTGQYAFSQGSRFTHWTLGERIAAPVFTLFGSQIDAPTLSGALLLIALVYAVFRYTLENSRRQSALEQEYRNARAVQQILIPDELPSIPGFRIQSIYKPAGEVGGDFFQILPLSSGGVLAIIGDVSGKGMPAAMMVSLLVGTVRTLVHYTQSPAEMLAAINQRMLGRSQGGFTTCLILRVEPGGVFTFANAGHLAPYCDGSELSCDNGLPLGLAADATYSESSGRLSEDQQITLLTDGIVEARSNSGELFGFARTAGVSTQSAENIAHAAQTFGQDDDITVLTVAFAG